MTDWNINTTRATASTYPLVGLWQDSTGRVVPTPWTQRHFPRQVLTCAQADRAADEQIDGLEEALREPCPHCGKCRD